MKLNRKLIVRPRKTNSLKLSVSIPEEMIKWIDKTAKTMGSDRSKVIQACVKRAQDEAELQTA